MKKFYKMMMASFIMLATGMNVHAQDYFTDYGTYGNEYGRALSSLTFLKNGVTFAEVAVNQETEVGVSPIYFDKTSELIGVKPGDQITVLFNWSGSWMHNIVYVDWNGDKTFSTDGDSERMGYNGAVEGSEVNNPITFTVPAEQALGKYRMRLMVDWLDEATQQSIPNSQPADPSNGINKNGGSVVDVTLNLTSLIAPEMTDARCVIVKGDAIRIDTEKGNTLKYTLDGSDPATSSTSIAVASNVAAVKLEGPTTVKAVAVDASNAMSAEFTAVYQTIDAALGSDYYIAFSRFGQAAATDQFIAVTERGEGEVLHSEVLVPGTTTQYWKLRKGSKPGLYTLTSKENRTIFYNGDRFAASSTATDATDLRIIVSPNSEFGRSYELQRAESANMAMNPFNGSNPGMEIGEWYVGDAGNPLALMPVGTGTGVDAVGEETGIQADNGNVEVYSMDGRLMSGKNRLSSGIYMVKANGKTKKVIVKK
ncbi:MAG: GEVED domain-containing protein [Prevotellaceae bacterium]|nr:GEVED domain-containing protein [Prevotellaceae bacterium]MDY6129947.1 GEVED domain-containing protein [Prevotella sp.]